MNITIKVDDSTFRRAMQGFERQIPYAIARALTATAKDAQAALKAHLDKHFTVRTPWVAKGIRIEPAKKSNLRAVVGSVDKFMEPQAVGGVKKPHEGRMVGIPLVGKGLPRPSIKSVTRPSKWPGGYTARGDAFVGKLRTDEEAVWQRVLKGKGKDRREGLRLLYVMKPEVRLEPRWPIRETVEETVAARWEDNARAAIREAIDTAR